MNFIIGALTGVATSIAAWLIINLLLRAKLRWTPIEMTSGDQDDIAIRLANKRRRSAIDISIKVQIRIPNIDPAAVTAIEDVPVNLDWLPRLQKASTDYGFRTIHLLTRLPDPTISSLCKRTGRHLPTSTIAIFRQIPGTVIRCYALSTDGFGGIRTLNTSADFTFEHFRAQSPTTGQHHGDK